MKTIKEFLLKYKHGFSMLIFSAGYLLWFKALESNTPKNLTLIHVSLDDKIPFCELFIIPYLLWFGYVLVAVLYFIFTSKEDYQKMFIFLATGMTLFLVISTLWPNGQNLRPLVMPRDNMFTRMIVKLYKTDTPTNLWPSIHVYNSLGVHFTIANSKQFEKKKWVKNSSLVLCTLIILSTMFIKQHSIFDVCTALLLGSIMYNLVFAKTQAATYFSQNKHKEAKHVA